MSNNGRKLSITSDRVGQINENLLVPKNPNFQRRGSDLSFRGKLKAVLEKKSFLEGISISKSVFFAQLCRPSLVDEDSEKKLSYIPLDNIKIEEKQKYQSSNTDSEIDEDQEVIQKTEEEPIRDALTGIIPDEWNNIPFPIIDAFKAIIKYLRKQDAIMVIHQEKHDELVEKHKFNIGRLNNEIEKVDTTYDSKVEKCEKNLANSFNELRKLIENKVQGTNHSLDKTNNTLNNLVAKAHRMGTKLDKIDETEQMKQWTNSRIDDERSRMIDYCFIQYFQKIKYKIKTKLKNENFQIKM